MLSALSLLTSLSALECYSPATAAALVLTLLLLQGREGKIVQVYRKKWVIHIERITREKVNGMPSVTLKTSLGTT